MDVAIRRGLYHVPTPCVSGSNFVGVVHKTSNEASGWRLGKRVAGLTLSGSNARYLTASTEWLLDVPKKLDASDIACILSIYLPAFQALHHGQPRPGRYSQTVLRRKRVLITGGTVPEAMAVLRMAHYGGAQEVYVVAERSQHNVLRQMYATPLDVHQDDWGPMVEGSMDVVVDFDYVQNEKAACMALAPRGRLVWYLHPSKRVTITGRAWSFDGIVQQTKMCLLEQASIYDQFESWAEHPYSFKVRIRIRIYAR
jgi:NADPH:quinone reductase-like Zn-dependent oxidoreductase